ncbi:helix-turn-helix domain-containing protein [Paenibacillus sp. P22]|uniref:response regulator transcription factor n=1 Tax=Paenibacillus sp. P22 TaxID=483908 RepID=UPI00066089D4|nr:helix-turn-helix domain-containing protein [Paenibacillus sp. P22]
MPEQSGLELMEWVKEEGMRLETVVLTCHSEFRYAQKALQLGGSDYILKPVIYRELEQVLQALGRKVEEQRQADHEGERYHQLAELWQGQKPLLTERYWKDLLDGRERPDASWLERIRLAADVDAQLIGTIRPLLISVENWEKDIDERDERVMEFALRKAAEEILLESLPGAVVEDYRGNSLILIYEGGAAAQRLEELCDRYREACRTYFYCKMSVYIGDAVPLKNLRGEYLGLLHEEYRNVSISWSSIPAGAASRGERHADALQPDSTALLEWADLLEQGGIESMRARLEELLMPGAAVTVETLTAYAYGLMQAAYLTLHRKGFPAFMLHQYREDFDVSAATRSVQRFRAWSEGMLGQIGVLLQSRRSESPVLRQIKAYIADHMDRDVTREELAEHVFLNPAYLSRLFRKETGKVLTDYILQEKMRAAAQRLTGTDESVSAIAAGLGYGNFSYFARLFRKVYGKNPHEFRKIGTDSSATPGA